ncbi:MAG: pyridoxamine 5'-phosphate oxidase family protein [Acidobacteriota bacterium]
MHDRDTQTERTRVKRLPKRGAYDRDTIYPILDEAFICHVGFAVEGQPYVIPTGYARIGDDLYIHGSSASRMLRNLAEGVDVCMTVTLIDGLVLARSAFHHSMNYRSVVILGKAVLVSDEKEKLEALDAFTEHIDILLHDGVLPVQPFLFGGWQCREGWRECEGCQLFELFSQFLLLGHYSFLMW